MHGELSSSRLMQRTPTMSSRSRMRERVLLFDSEENKQIPRSARNDR
jgi:hypothetical protein